MFTLCHSKSHCTWLVWKYISRGGLEGRSPWFLPISSLRLLGGSMSGLVLHQSPPFRLPTLSQWPWGMLKLNTPECEACTIQKGCEGNWTPLFMDEKREGQG